MRHSLHSAVLGLALSSLVLGAPVCGLPPPPTWDGSAWLAPLIIETTQGSSFDVHIAVNTVEDVQAVEFAIAVDDPALVTVLGASDNPGFDDDGTLFVPAIVNAQAGTIDRVVDLRHGTPATGVFQVATLHFEAVQVGQTALRITRADIAKPTGGGLIFERTVATITVDP